MRAHPTPVTVLSIAASALVGVAAGVGGYTFVYAEGFSYLTDEPAACNNCHAMNDHYGAWIKGSHHAVAACNDCHTPPGCPAKYVAKAINGFNHSLAFTTGRFPDQIQVTERNRKVSEAQCRHCHAPLVGQMEAKVPGGEPLSCLRCPSATWTDEVSANHARARELAPARLPVERAPTEFSISRSSERAEGPGDKA